MSEQKLPDFMLKYIDQMEDGHAEMYKLATEYYAEKLRFDNNLGTNGPNDEASRVRYNKQIEWLKNHYQLKALNLGKDNGYKEPESENRELSREEKKVQYKENANDITEVPDNDERAKFIADLMAAKERNRDHDRDYER